MLSSQTQASLRALGVEATHASDFYSGLNLLHLISQAFHGGENPALASKLQLGGTGQTASYVINLNILLNHLKKHQDIEIDDHIRQLTPFVLLDEQDG